MIQRWDLGTIANTGQKTMYKEENGRFVKLEDCEQVMKEKDIEVEAFRDGITAAQAEIAALKEEHSVSMAELNEKYNSSYELYEVEKVEHERTKYDLASIHEEHRREVERVNQEWFEKYKQRVSEIDALRRNLTEARQEVVRMKELTWCAYCGHEIHIDDEAATKISEHIMSCEKHPIHIAFAEIETLRAERDELRRKLDKWENQYRRIEP